ncbi:MAG: DUF2812 domain-containing protein [Christensenella sp.]|nr:DUF2812 domain-containing protein [Christensenella sp.]
MKHIVYKAYWNFEKEERWLNDMAAKGLALTDYTWCRYAFEETPRGQYLYRIELLENLPSHPESQAYLRFLEENGVEVVTSYMRWVYLRRDAADGPFDIYTDLNSQIQHYKRVSTFLNAMTAIEWSVGACNLAVGIANLVVDGQLGNFSNGNFVLGVCLVALGFMFFFLGMPIRRKIRALKKQQAITE